MTAYAGSQGGRRRARRASANSWAATSSPAPSTSSPGWLHQAVRFNLNHPGGYEVYLTDTPGVHTAFAGFLGPTTSVAAGWTQFSFSFTATPEMASLDFLEFAPVVTGAGTAYPGLDLVSLTAIPEPGTLSLLGLSLAALFHTRRRRSRR